MESPKPLVLRSDDLPIEGFLGPPTANCGDVEMLEGSDKQKWVEQSSSTKQGFFQEELNNLVSNLNLSKNSAKILALRLKEKHCFQSGVTITSFRTREQDLLPYSTEKDKLVFCNNVSRLLNCMSLPK